MGHSCGSLLYCALFWDTRDTANHPAHQRRAAFAPAAWFARPSGTAPRKRTKAAQIASSLRSRRHAVCPVCPHTRSCPIARYRQSHLYLNRALDTHDLRRGLCRTGPKRTLCISRPRRVRFPQRVARDRAKTQSHLQFAPSTRTISTEGCPRPDQNAISPAFRALDTHDLRRGLPATGPKRKGSPAFRALDTRSLRRGLNPKRTLACIRPRHARSPRRVGFRGAPAAPPQRVAPDTSNTQSPPAFRASTRAISAEGCPRQT